MPQKVNWYYKQGNYHKCDNDCDEGINAGLVVQNGILVGLFSHFLFVNQPAAISSRHTSSTTLNEPTGEQNMYCVILT